MDYEKAYNEAIKRAKAIIEVAEKEEEVYKSAITIFPELRESEDERIRKHLISLVKNWDKGGIVSKYTSNANDIKQILAWLEKQGKETNWKPSKEEMDVLYGLAYITNQYDEHKEEVITRLYQDLKREFFNGSSYENMFPTNISTEDDVRRRSTIQVLEYARSLDTYNQYGKADIDKNIAWLEKQKEPELSEDLGEYVTELNKQFPEVSFAKLSRIAVRVKNWLEKQGEHANFLSKIQVGDKVTRNEGGVLVNISQLERIAKPRRVKHADKVEQKSQRMVSAEAKEALYDKPTDEEMKELLRTEYEKGRADTIAETEKLLKAKE